VSDRRLFLFVEGDDDERFLRAVLKPRLDRQYDSVTLWQYAKQKSDKIRAFLRSVKAIKADYAFLADINRQPCVTARKRKLGDRLPELDEDKAVVVVMEIESWYMAGAEDSACERLGLRPSRSTDTLTKEQFDALIPKRFDSRVDFMAELLKCFSVEAAKERNHSFRYFVERHVDRNTR
jgi:hypothetical protein